MKDIKVSIAATNVKSLKYDNQFNAKPGEPLKMEVKTQVGIRLNPASPTTALVMVKYESGDPEKKTIALEVETVTAVNVSSFVDNLDDVIKKNYMPHIMMAVHEKVRSISSIVGLSIQVPPIAFPYNENGSSSIDSEIYTKI